MDAARSQREGSAAEPQILEALPPPPDRLSCARPARMVQAGKRCRPRRQRALRDDPVQSRRWRPGRAAGTRSRASRSTAPSGVARQTRPPQRYTRHAAVGDGVGGKVIDDEALRAAMKDCGLERLPRAGDHRDAAARVYIVLDKQHLAPTALGIGLIAA